MGHHVFHVWLQIGNRLHCLLKKRTLLQDFVLFPHIVVIALHPVKLCLNRFRKLLLNSNAILTGINLCELSREEVLASLLRVSHNLTHLRLSVVLTIDCGYNVFGTEVLVNPQNIFCPLNGLVYFFGFSLKLLHRINVAKRIVFNLLGFQWILLRIPLN